MSACYGLHNHSNFDEAYDEALKDITVIIFRLDIRINKDITEHHRPKIMVLFLFVKHRDNPIKSKALQFVP
jgi:hypothetical protein